MKIAVLSMWQPWASLWLATDDLGRVKVHETRGWPYPPALQGKRIAVHASQTERGYGTMSAELRDLCDDVFGPHYGLELPRGGVIGSIALRSCERIDYDEPCIAVTDANYISGDYTAGRFMWEGTDPVLMREPIPLKGRQRIFYWDAPDDFCVTNMIPQSDGLQKER